MQNEFTVVPARTRRAFTLVELLVVISILAILAVILFPSLKAFTERGKSAACLGNMRTMTVVALQWVGEHGVHAYPGFPWPKGGGPTSVNWASELFPTYLPKELRCPSKPANSANNSAGYDYGWRYAIHNVVWDLGTATGYVPASRIVIASEMYYMPDGISTAYHLDMTSRGDTTGGIKQSHQGGLHLGFADGHVELVQAPKDPAGNVNWLYPPACARDLKTGYYYDYSHWYKIIVRGYTSW